MAVSVVTVRNPRAVLLLESLLQKAVAATPGMAPGGFDTITKSLLQYVTDPMRYMMVGFEDNEPTAICLWAFPNDPMFPYPTVVALYSEGSQKVKWALVNAMFDIIYQIGYKKIVVINSSGHSTDVWARGVVPRDRLTYKVLGEAVELTFLGAPNVTVATTVRGRDQLFNAEGPDPTGAEGTPAAIL